MTRFLFTRTTVLGQASHHTALAKALSSPQNQRLDLNQSPETPKESVEVLVQADTNETGNKDKLSTGSLKPEPSRLRELGTPGTYRHGHVGKESDFRRSVHGDTAIPEKFPGALCGEHVL